MNKSGDYVVECVYLSLTIIKLQKGFTYLHCTRNTNILHFSNYFPNFDENQADLSIALSTSVHNQEHQPQ